MFKVLSYQDKGRLTRHTALPAAYMNTRKTWITIIQIISFRLELYKSEYQIPL